MIFPEKAPPAMTLVEKHPEDYADIYIYISDEFSVFMTYLERPPPGCVKRPLDQLELPIAAFLWLIDVIENKFWKSPAEGGLDDVYHMMGTFNDEKIRIGRSANAGAEGVTGFSITNYGRSSYIAKTTTQDIVIPDALLEEGGLFERLKTVASRIKAGESPDGI